MRHGSLARTSVVSVVAGVCLLAAPAWAQAPTSGIAGVVRDTSGAVLPGVSVEAASPALIEQVRVVTTDGQGRYNIVDLRPGVYSVTFTLPGFSSIRRVGIELSTGFTASVNVEMTVGALEETITVAGAAPQVDAQSVRQLTVVRKEALDALPLGQGSTSSFVALIPGMTDAGKVDIGGTGGHWEGGRATYGTYHGKRGLRTTFDGMRTQNTGTGQAPGYTVNTHFVQEVSLETGGVTAEGSSTGMAMNMVPKEGGNSFNGLFAGKYMNEGMQSSNLTDVLRARGMTTDQKVSKLEDIGGYVGGPIRQDRLWFYAGARRWGFDRQIPGLFENATLGTLFYTKDLSRPVLFDELNQSYGGRLTWQASAKNKVGFFMDYQDLWGSHGRAGSPTTAPEAQSPQRLRPSGIVQGTWQSVRTSKFLLEAGAAWMIWHNHSGLQPAVPQDAISILEQSTGMRYNAPQTYYGGGDWSDPWVVDRYVQRFGASYVTGSHNYKVGIQLEQGDIRGGIRKSTGPNGGAVSYTFNNGVPASIRMANTPFEERAKMTADLGLYAQDQWTIDRLTVSYGLRFEYWKGEVPAQTVPATRFLPERVFEAVRDVPNYKDLNPRFGAAYDLFGNSRTALKVSAGRYSDLTGVFYTQVNDPQRTSISSVTRAWNDSFFGAGDPRSGNFIPDCDLINFAANGECRQISNSAFGQFNPNVVRFSDEVMRGWNKRKYTWDIAAEVQHQITQGLSVTAGYYHNWDGNVRVLVNEAVTPADHDPYCITTPTDLRLPGGGGQQVCGLYNINEAKFGRFADVWVQSNNYGNGTTRVSDFVSAAADVRLPSGIRFGGGVDTGRTVTDNCFVVDSPQATRVVNITAAVGERAVEQRFCHEVLDLLANLQIKFNAIVPLPGGFATSATFQNLTGDEIQANYTATSAQIRPSLGRPLSGGVSNVSIPLIAPGTEFENRRTQVDLRLTRTFRVGQTRLEANAELYNIFNANSVFAPNPAYGPSWLQPASVVPGRMLQLGGKLTF